MNKDNDFRNDMSGSGHYTDQNVGNDNDYKTGDNYGRRKRRDYYEEQVPVDISVFKNDKEGEELSKDVDSFEDLNLKESILRGVFSYGFEKPSPIQAKAIRPFLARRDVIAQAQSGTGKTGTFCLSMLGSIDEDDDSTQGLILSHTRELASQTEMVLRKLGNFTKIRYNLSVKGIPIGKNIEDLSKRKDKPHIVVGTPGRILDMISKRALSVRNIKYLVLDEADEMLSKGFLEQVHKIFMALPSKELQVGLYSATMDPNFFNITEQFMRNPVNILVKAEQLTLEGIKQYYVDVQKNEYKFDVLCDLFSILTINQSMIYCNSKKTVEDISYRLNENGFTVSVLHGDMTPKERELTMMDFRNGKSRVLVSTDLLSRGIDVQQVSVVICLDIPNKVESYLHRIGRSGRYGRKGVAINFTTYYDNRKLQNIEKYYNTIIDPLPENINELVN